MAKSLTAPYEAGRRGAGWLKVKPVHTLDLVVLAVEWGSGRRRGKLSNIHLGARDPATGGYVMLGKTFKGMTDAMLDWQTARFQELAVGGTDGYVVQCGPSRSWRWRSTESRPRRATPAVWRCGSPGYCATATTRDPTRPTPSTPCAPCTAVKLTPTAGSDREAPWQHRSHARHLTSLSYVHTDADLPPVAIIDRSPIGTGHKIFFGVIAAARRRGLGGHRLRSRRDGQRGLVRRRGDLHLRHRIPVLRAADRGQDRPSPRRPRHSRQKSSTTAPTTCRPTGGCCSATISPPSPGPARWSGRCWPPRWAICRAASGSSSARCSPAPCRTTWCCGFPPGGAAARLARWPATSSAPSAVPPLWSGPSSSW